MRRTVIAVAWIAGATVPLLLATVFLFGCCVLPFHQVMHKLMPVCNLAASILRGGDETRDPQPLPAREKQEPSKRMATELPQPFRLLAVSGTPNINAPAASRSYRSFITLGAVRCDQDIGLHLLVATFRI